MAYADQSFCVISSSLFFFPEKSQLSQGLARMYSPIPNYGSGLVVFLAMYPLTFASKIAGPMYQPSLALNSPAQKPKAAPITHTT